RSARESRRSAPLPPVGGEGLGVGVVTNNRLVMLRRLVWIVVIAGALLPASRAGWTQEPFYAGKTLRIVVGTSAGGGFDTYARAIGRHLGKHLPGHPTVIVDNMPGAGGLVAANTVYRIAKPDGLTIATFVGTVLLSRLYDRPGAEFDALKF